MGGGDDTVRLGVDSYWTNNASAAFEIDLGAGDDLIVVTPSVWTKEGYEGALKAEVSLGEGADTLTF